jgi:hypothetical protein
LRPIVQGYRVPKGIHAAALGLGENKPPDFNAGANATAEASDNSLAHERDAFWRGIVRYHENQ